MKRVFALLLIFILIFASCSSRTGQKYLMKSPGYLTHIVSASVPDDDYKSAINSFALDLYKELFDEKSNVFISPASIYLALGMTYNGAFGDTAKEMASVLYADNIPLENFNKESRNLQYIMTGNAKKSFKLANSVWIRDTYSEKVKEDFLTRNKDYFGAMISALDFNSRSTVNTINNWVKSNTKGRIEKAIDGPIDPLTVMFLINTIYFKADWLSQFEANDTYKRGFHAPAGTVNIDTMSKTEEMGYFENDFLQGVRLPYADNSTSMLILLPKQNHEDLVSKLSHENLDDIISGLYNNETGVTLYMPKVKLSYDAELKRPLSELGMSSAFLSRTADFSAMAHNAIEEGLHIGGVTHKTFLMIDEKGTEAAAMTKVEMKNESAMLSDIVVDINRPFLTAIVDDKSGTLLFLGSVVNPQE